MGARSPTIFRLLVGIVRHKDASPAPEALQPTSAYITYTLGHARIERKKKMKTKINKQTEQMGLCNGKPHRNDTFVPARKNAYAKAWSEWCGEEKQEPSIERIQVLYGTQDICERFIAARRGESQRNKKTYKRVWYAHRRLLQQKKNAIAICEQNLFAEISLLRLHRDIKM